MAEPALQPGYLTPTPTPHLAQGDRSLTDSSSQSLLSAGRAVYLPLSFQHTFGRSGDPSKTVTPISPTPSPKPSSTPPSSSTPTPTTAPGCPEGMAACWRFEETSGSQFADTAGGNTATCSGSTCPSFSQGVAGGGLAFDGVQNYLTVSPDPSLTWGNWNSFTIEVWVKMDGSCEGNKVFIGMPRSQDHLGTWWLGCDGDTRAAAFYLRDSNGTSFKALGSKPVNNGRWHHIAAVRDRLQNQLILYVDGEVESSAGAVYSGDFASESSIYIGGFGGEYLVQAVIDEAAISSSALPHHVLRTHFFLARPYCQSCGSAVRIMPLGDSITLGTGSPAPYEGYRRPLDHALSSLEFDFDLVGGLVSGGDDFDPDHEGHGGWHAGGHPTRSIMDHVYEWLVASPPDVVLLHAGTNDINDGGQSAAEVSGILDEIDRFDKNITVILALIINRQVYSEATTLFNLDVLEMANQRIVDGDKIIVVDMESALTYPDDMDDLLHPNVNGYFKMNTVWLDALLTFWPVCP